jgi:hypothetical protein
MDRYDPEVAPDAEGWLALDEDERLLLVEWYHRDVRADISKAARPLHASMHVVVENQLASNDEPVVRALARLMKRVYRDTMRFTLSALWSRRTSTTSSR